MLAVLRDLFEQSAIEKALLKMDRHLNSREEQLLAFRSLSSIADNDGRVINKVLRTMKRHPTSSEIQYEACKVLRNSDLSNKDIVPAVLHALRTHPYDGHLHAEGSSVLYEMAKKDADVLSYALSPTLDAMSTFTSDQNMQCIGCKIIGLINIKLPHIVTSRARRAVIRALELYSKNIELVDAGLHALCVVISKTNQTCKQAEACALHAMVHHLSEKEIQKKAMDVLKNVKPNHRIYSSVALAMDHFPDCYQLQLAACEIFQHCVSIEYNHHLLITRAIHFFPDKERLHELGLFSISSLSYNEKNHDELILSGVIGCVFGAINKWSLSNGVQEAAFHILQDLSVNKSTYRLLMFEDIHEFMIRAMDKCKDNRAVLISICDIITNMSTEYRTFFMEQGMYVRIQRIIYCHLLNTDIRLAAETAAFALVTEPKDEVF